MADGTARLDFTLLVKNSNEIKWKNVRLKMKLHIIHRLKIVQEKQHVWNDWCYKSMPSKMDKLEDVEVEINHDLVAIILVNAYLPPAGEGWVKFLEISKSQS